MTVMTYRTQDGFADYGFSIEFQPWTGWRVYIIFRPFHQDHDDSARLPHQAIDDIGRCYVNWSAKVDSLGEARTVAELWAEMIQRYERAEIEKQSGAAAAKQQSTLRGLRTDAA
ncbi:MAG: hypothetical protein LC749_22595 [Actinobacteria bacterium]|nr:hypothetical protein [Actinomycetota bacterium]